jgi:hypothetical protein
MDVASFAIIFLTVVAAQEQPTAEIGPTCWRMPEFSFWKKPA